MSALEELKKYTKVVADTGEFQQIEKYQPLDATTNPSLITAAFNRPEYSSLKDNAIQYALKTAASESLAKKVELAMDKLAVNFGAEILKIVPGRVSTEIDARLSYDTEATVKKAREIYQLYRDIGINPQERVLVKIASTWEGIQAAKQLEEEGIHCNLTLLFSLVQAQACAEAKVTLISPFVGRITDFYKKKDGVEGYDAPKDPGVVSVTQIFNYYKKFGYQTVVMGASFRNIDQIIELAGCDLLTVSPKLLEELSASQKTVAQKLDASKPDSSLEKVVPDQKIFLWEMNQNEMAHFKTAEGIRNFTTDLIKLENALKAEIEKL